MNAQKISLKQERMLPPNVAAVLRIRESVSKECPEQILKTIQALKVGKVAYQYKISLNSSPSSGNLSGWRNSKNNNNNFKSSTWSPNSAQSPRKLGGENSPRNDEEYQPRRFRGPSDSPIQYAQGGRYISSIVSDKKVEDRIIGHIRAKLNKFSHNNYDSIKAFLEQIMTSGETKFLSEFMDLLFTKAASEEIYCELYSRLLAELSEKFPHLKIEISNIYTNFISIFQEARDIPDQGAEDYKKFLEAQERKKYRKGYSHFVSELSNRNLITAEEIDTCLTSILKSLNKLEDDKENTLLVEEYLVSLFKIVTTLKAAKSKPLPPYIVNILDSLKKTLAKPQVDTPGYTNKSRFKIMDIIDILPS